MSNEKADAPKQPFTYSHLRDSKFTSDGLRNYAAYRDLGFAEATHGMVDARVLKMLPPYKPEEAGRRHRHDVQFQMVYLFKGWIKYDFEGHGEITMEAGSSWIQPPNCKHTVLGYSDDCELLEIVMPATYDTVDVEPYPHKKAEPVA